MKGYIKGYLRFVNVMTDDELAAEEALLRRAYEDAQGLTAITANIIQRLTEIEIEQRKRRGARHEKVANE